jgi:hypothetical protein
VVQSEPDTGAAGCVVFTVVEARSVSVDSCWVFWGAFSESWVLSVHRVGDGVVGISEILKHSSRAFFAVRKGSKVIESPFLTIVGWFFSFWQWVRERLSFGACDRG